MLSPKEISNKFEGVGIAKTSLSVGKMIILGILAGMFIALAGVGSTLAGYSIEAKSVSKLVGACVFPAGLAMVVVAGSELFTGNSLIMISVLKKKVKPLAMLKNWLFVYIGNFIGALLVSFLVAFSGVLGSFEGLQNAVVGIAQSKSQLNFTDAFIKGILCNFLVCIAVWMATAADTVFGKIAAVFFPIMLFVLCGFEHSVANMYYMPAGIFVNLKYSLGVDLSIGNMLLNNLLPVTLGNIVGGAGLVALPYFLAYKGEN